MNYDFQINYSEAYTRGYFEYVIAKTFTKNDNLKIITSLRLAAHYHKNQVRSDGSRYIAHPIRVALLLLKHEQAVTSNLIIAALLHDALEDTDFTELEIILNFGEAVLTYVKGATRYREGLETPNDRKTGKTEKWKQTMKASWEIRVIKTFDYLDNIISMKFIKPDMPHYGKISRWLMEAQTMYVPLAEITNKQAHKLLLQEINYYLGKGFQTGDWYSG